MEKRATVNGVEVRIDPDKMRDIDVVEAVVEANDDQASEIDRLAATVRLFKLVYGDEQYARIKDALRAKSEDGVVSADDMAKFFGDTSAAINALKN